MNIAYLSNSILPSRYANCINVMKMCQAFSTNGHDVTLYARYGQLFSGSDYNRYGVLPCFKIVKSWRPQNMFPKNLRLNIYNYQVKRKLTTSNAAPDLLYGRDINTFRALAHLDIPMVYEAHYAPHQSHDMDTIEYIFRHKNFKRLVVISNTLKEKYLEIFPWLREDMIIVAHNGADLPKASPAAITDWPGSTERLQVGYVGHLYKGKGMEIISKIVPQVPEADFHIVGGMPNDIKYWQKQCNFSNIHFHGYIDHGNLDSYFQKFDVVLAPYTSGELNAIRAPIKIFEYMSIQKPILASDMAMVKEVLTHRVNSLLANPDNTAEWVAALHELMSDKSLGENIAEQAYQEFLAQYTWQNRAKRVLDGI